MVSLKKYLLSALLIFILSMILFSLHVAFLPLGALLITILTIRFVFKTQWEIDEQSREKFIDDIANKVIEKTNKPKP